MSNPKISSKVNLASLAPICLGGRTMPGAYVVLEFSHSTDVIMVMGILYEGLVQVISRYQKFIMSASAVFTSATLILNETHDRQHTYYPPTKRDHHGVTSKDYEV